MGRKDAPLQLVIGNKAWSTWSLRPWLVLKRAGIAFEEIRVRLRQDDTSGQIQAFSPSGKVPALLDGDLVVWDSLAICEYLADRFPRAGLWPDDIATRARARSAAAEMHSGFSALRNQCPMDLGLITTLELSEDTEKDVRRLVAMINDLRRRHGVQGAFLCGAWSIADAFLTPVATRFRTYGVDLSHYGDSGQASAYADVLLSTPEFLQWEREAKAQ